MNRNITNRRVATSPDGSWFYPTPTWATKAFLENITLYGEILEPCCGDGAISKVLEEFGYTVKSSDLFDRGYGNVLVDAFSYKDEVSTVLTNPPFAIADDLFHHFFPLVKSKLCLFLRTAFLEGADRYVNIYRKTPPTHVYVYTQRVTLFPNNSEKMTGGTTSFSWFVWDKYLMNQNYETKIIWIKPGYKPNSRFKL